MRSQEFWDVHVKYDSLKVRDKHRLVWHFITDVYPMLFDPIRYTMESILELGVWKGGSVKAFHDYFPNTRIIGVDIDLSTCAAFGLPDSKTYPRMTLLTANQGNVGDMRNLGEGHGPFEVIIDDAGHKYSQQITSFEALWPYVAPGGLYIIEDVFYRSRGHAHMLLNYFKDKVDPEYFLNPGPYEVQDGKVKDLSGVSFYQGLIIVRKNPDIDPENVR